MADPVSIASSIPTFATLPAVALQAVKTLDEFLSSVRNAQSDTINLLEDMRMLLSVIVEIELPVPAGPQEKFNNGRWTEVQLSAAERVTSFCKRLGEIKLDLERSPAGAHMRTYLIEKYMEGERQRISELKSTLILLVLEYVKHILPLGQTIDESPESGHCAC